REEASQRQLPPSGGIAVHVTRQRLGHGPQHTVARGRGVLLRHARRGDAEQTCAEQQTADEASVSSSHRGLSSSRELVSRPGRSRLWVGAETRPPPTPCCTSRRRS